MHKHTAESQTGYYRLNSFILHQQGTPPECDPESMCWWKSLTVVLHSNFFWSHDPCEEYYKAVLAEPLWEVTPLKVSIYIIITAIVFSHSTNNTIMISFM